jgi:hypothetical protein
MEDYDDAMNGYEFLALFHPDPDIRLSASWDYEEIEALLGSGGGAISNPEFTHIEEFKELERFEKIINDNPKMKRLKDSYEKASLERVKNLEKSIMNESNNEEDLKINFRRANEIDKLKQDKARRNLFELKNLNKEQLERRRVEDLLIMTKDFREQKTVMENLSTPFEYKLDQNFPNPFNPVTKINFEIPMDGLISIKVFDITGREVSMLLNEFKQIGKYSIDFNGSNLPSGVYFYKLVSRDFTAVKRMVLVK